MFKFNISIDLIKAARKKLKQDINSKHSVVRRFERQVEKNSVRHVKMVWIMTFLSILMVSVISSFGTKNYFNSFHIFFILIFLLLFPTLIAITVANILVHLFYKKYDIPAQEPTYVPSTSTPFSRHALSDSTISINPASGLPMCGSVDVSGNAPGHSHRY